MDVERGPLTTGIYNASRLWLFREPSNNHVASIVLLMANQVLSCNALPAC